VHILIYKGPKHKKEVKEHVLQLNKIKDIYRNFTYISFFNYQCEIIKWDNFPRNFDDSGGKLTIQG